MKAEKMFLLINEIDDRLIMEAEAEDLIPQKITIERSLPFKEAIAFAALAAGIFAIVKFRVGGKIPPYTSGEPYGISSSYSTESGDPSVSGLSSANSATDSAPDPASNDSSTVSDNGTTESEPESKPIEKVRGVYGETEIPDVNWRDIDSKDYASIEDYVRARAERDAMRLDSMVFETHELGDYKISLVGEDVWVDKELSSDKIYTRGLKIEVEKNGVKLDGPGFTSYKHEMFLGVSQYVTHTVIKDKIGSYLDVYDMDVPVIAMKYYFDYDIPNSVDRALMFATVQEEAVWSLFAGDCKEGTCLSVKCLEPANYYYTMDGGERVRNFHPFGNDKFKIADGKTLIDETEGIKYTFDFSDPMLDERYTAEKIV